MPVKARPIAERFWEKVRKTEGCWEWTGHIAKHGYGSFGVSFKPTRSVVAHRISYQLVRGPIPDGLDVLHKCDNRKCVRPDHLFLGTQADNNHDMKMKGRAAKGTKHFRAKLDPDKVRDIRRSRKAGESPFVTAKRLGVAPPTVYAVLKGLTWGHVKDEEANEC